MTVSARLSQIAEAVAQSGDPKKALLDSLGQEFIDGIDVFHNLVLVATFVRSNISKGGVHLVDRTLAEDRFQGKAGLVIKMGPQAFKDDDKISFGGVKINVGDWVMYRPADGLEMFAVDSKTGRDGTPCRLLEDVSIKARIAEPSLIY